MGRRAQGYVIREPRTPGGCYTVRFRIDGKRQEPSTGERDFAAASREGRAIYAAALAGESPGSAARRCTLTARLVGAWIDDLALRPSTKETYETYATHFLTELKTVDDARISAYVRSRLKQVRGKTVGSEVSALRSLAKWLVETGHLAEMPTIPRIDSSKLGVKFATRRRVAAPELSPAEVKKVLAKLPVKARSGWWVRARCEFLYETGLRPATVDNLRVPDHWAPKSKRLRITLEIDKEGFEREVPLTPKALSILKKCAPDEGVIFGEHRYDWYVRPAAAVLPPAKAAVFTGQHLRSARLTHLLEAGASLMGVQYIAGHNYTTTTSRYTRPSLRAADEALKAVR